MIIDLKAISQEPKEFILHLERDWWQPSESDDQILGLNGPLESQIGIFPVDDKYLLKGRLMGSIIGLCDRCLESFPHHLEADFQLFLAVTPAATDQAETELTDDDTETHFLESEEFELDEILREQIYLSLPMKFLCADNCKGLCSSCGMNLNQGDCPCPKEQGHSGFAQLKHFKIGGKQK